MTPPGGEQQPAAIAAPPASASDNPAHGPASRPAGPNDLSAHMARFAAALRVRGVDIGLQDQADALEALTLVDIGDPDEVLLALGSALKVPRRHRDVFHLLFERMWRRGETELPDTMPAPSQEHARPAFEIRRAATGAAPDEGDGEPRRRTSAGYSPEALLRRKTFDECTPADLAAMQRLLDRLARKLATRPTRRLVPDRRGNVVDVRRSLRRALAGDGDILELARRRRAVERPHLVLLCDTSGSMDDYARFLLAFALSLERVAPRTEAFAFNTSLTRLTGWITPANLMATLERLARGVPDWSGGTRIGASLMEFSERWLERTVRADTTVLILSDGLDRGDTELLEEALARIRRRARRILWLNPLAGDARYRPEARGMKAALPYIDRLLPAHDLAALERLFPLLAA